MSLCSKVVHEQCVNSEFCPQSQQLRQEKKKKKNGENAERKRAVPLYPNPHKVAFGYVGLNWKDHVVIDKRYFRPTEVDNLKGDASRVKKVLDWKP
nr:gdp-mannose 4,6 dehydratase 1 [Quercus suber]